MSFIDPITLEQISQERLVTFELLGLLFYFDVLTLARMDNNINPMNRLLLPIEVIHRIDEYKRSMELQVLIYSRSKINFVISRLENIGRLILEMYKVIDINLIGGHQIELSWISCNERFRRNPFLLDLDMELHLIIDSNSCTLSLLPTKKGRGSRLNMLYKYSYRHEIAWLLELIPLKYQENPPTLVSPNHLDYQLMKDFLLLNKGKEDSYISLGLRKFSVEAFLSAEMANEICNLVENPILKEVVSNIINQRVIDRFNLPFDSKYYTDPYDVPTEFVEKSNTPTYMDYLLQLITII